MAALSEAAAGCETVFEANKFHCIYIHTCTWSFSLERMLFGNDIKTPLQ